MISVYVSHGEGRALAKLAEIISTDIHEIISEVLLKRSITVCVETGERKDNTSDIEIEILAETEDFSMRVEFLDACSSEIGKRIRRIIDQHRKEVSGFLRLKLKQPAAFGAF